MTKTPLTPLDFHLLYSFSVVAEECNLHRAAQRLFMSQPPLSRQIKRLEERLGFALFIRHTRGLILTEEGEQVLETIRPLLALQAKTFQDLALLEQPPGTSCAIGFTTAFEQGIFADMEERLRQRYDTRLRVARKPSPKLVRDVRGGRLAAAFVALPLETGELTTLALDHEEALVAALPAHWEEATRTTVSLREMSGKPLFWFRREQNPAFFDHMRAVFIHIGFAPRFVEEPAEHDVLLARIASGEGMGLMPASFASIRRDNLMFIPVSEAAFLRIRLGIVYQGEYNPIGALLSSCGRR